MSIYMLPTDLPVPLDDGACDHLLGRSVPAIVLDSSRGPARDHAAVLDELGASLVGLSAQTLAEQVALAERERMPFPVDADPERRLGSALGMPTFEFEGATSYKRVTPIAEKATILKVFYPVFPPDRNAGQVVAWLNERSNG
jgi:peroxiredoxin